MRRGQREDKPKSGWTNERRVWVVVAAAILVFAFVVTRAHDEPRKSDFWSVAVPGAVTGFGTLGLAAITFWLAMSERKRDDRLRRLQRDEVEEARREEREISRLEHQAELAAQDERDATCIVTICGSHVDPSLFPGHLPDGVMADVTVVNGSAAPILNLRLETAFASGTEEYGTLAFRAGSDDLNRPDEWTSPVLLPRDSVTFDGVWHRDQGSNEAIPAHEAALLRGEQSDAVITWTDVRGNRWKRVGDQVPDRLA